MGQVNESESKLSVPTAAVLGLLNSSSEQDSVKFDSWLPQSRSSASKMQK